MELKEYRREIDEIDGQLVELLKRRLGISAEIGKYKAANRLPIYDPEREREKLGELARLAGDDCAILTDAIYPLIFDISRSAQHRVTAGPSPIREMIAAALESTPAQLPERPLVACQGVEGAYSQLACERIFSHPGIMYFKTFEAVFSAVEHGLCQYGVLPLENSTAGSVNRIYDLMIQHDFYISRSCRVKVDHCLLANPGVELGDVREIFSHEQAISQCSDFLKKLGDVKVTACENTAAAAKYIFESGRRDAAALSSQSCADIYSLNCIERSVQNNEGNFTRFICISKDLNIYPGANRTSLMMVLPNHRGSLYRVLSRFTALGINLIKLESRPLPNSDFEFMFYFDLDASVYSDEFLRVFDDLETAVARMKYLGSYSEVV